MRALQIPDLTEEQQTELAELYRSTKDVSIRTRAQMVLLACEQHLSAPAIAVIVREDDETVRRWLTRYLDMGREGLQDRPRRVLRRKSRRNTKSNCWKPSGIGLAAWSSPIPCGRCNGWRPIWLLKQASRSPMKPFVVCWQSMRSSSVGLSTPSAAPILNTHEKKDD